MSYAASVADGSQLKIGSPLVKVEGVEGLDGPGRNRSEVIVTAIDDSVEKKLSGKAKLDDITFTLRYDPANTQHAALEAANKANTQVSAQLLLSDAGAATLDFTATVPVWKHVTHQDAPTAVQAALRPTSDWTLTP